MITKENKSVFSVLIRNLIFSNFTIIACLQIFSDTSYSEATAPFPRTIWINILIHYIPSSEILEFSSVINVDIITSDDINFPFHFLP